MFRVISKLVKYSDTNKAEYLDKRRIIYPENDQVHQIIF
jgi:hypothetical protein